MRVPIRPGTVLYGYCGGSFGRDSYGAKRVEAVGADWVVVREGSHPGFYSGDPEDLLEYTVPRCVTCDARLPNPEAACGRCGA